MDSLFLSVASEQTPMTTAMAENGPMSKKSNKDRQNQNASLPFARHLPMLLKKERSRRLFPSPVNV